ncbi:hypothetical protein KFU94_61220 [Chloroflexi bacterium TSY]|nr:hypothetical protein [Chloroflexi bacterium TSY]
MIVIVSGCIAPITLTPTTVSAESSEGDAEEFKAEEGLDFEQTPQKWQLVRMSGQMRDSETTGTNMAWQESYQLNTDGTFIKSREQNGVLEEKAGVFSFEELSDGKYLILTYETYSGIIGNCTLEPREVLRLESNQKLLGTWWACDGPGLEYERIE